MVNFQVPASKLQRKFSFQTPGSTYMIAADII